MRQFHQNLRDLTISERLGSETPATNNIFKLSGPKCAFKVPPNWFPQDRTGEPVGTRSETTGATGADVASWEEPPPLPPPPPETSINADAQIKEADKHLTAR